MEGRIKLWPVILGLLILVLISGTFFTVHQTQQAIVLQFGKPVAIHREPGLKLKIPFVQDVEFFDSRLLEFNAEPKELIAADQKRLIVDAFVRYRITDPLRFRQTVGDERIMNSRLNAILESTLRQVVGSVPLSAVISSQRAKIMRDIRDLANQQASGFKATHRAEGDKVPRGFGIEVVDVRIKRADLPQQNSEAIFNRMRTARIKEAKEIRAQGSEDAQKIRSRAERDRTVLLAEAQQKAQGVRGEGDGQATKITAEAFSRDPDFYNFYRSLQAYRKSIGSKDTRLILSPNSPFLRTFDLKP